MVEVHETRSVEVPKYSPEERLHYLSVALRTRYGQDAPIRRASEIKIDEGATQF